MIADLGKITMIAKGEYDASTQYEVLDTVTYQSSMYIAKQTTQGNAPTNTTYWMLAAQGNDELVQKVLGQIPPNTITTTNGVASVNDSSNLPLKDVQILGNATQADTPTPTTPQAIRVVTGDNTIKIQGKNLFNINGNINTKYDGTVITSSNKNTISGNDLTAKINFNTSAPYGQKIYVGIGNVVTISGVLKSVDYSTQPSADDNVAGLGFYNDNTTEDRASLSFTYNEINTRKYTQFTATTDYMYLCFARRTPVNSATFTDIQLEIGSTATTYEPYQGQSLTLPLGDIELASIGTYKDYIYKNSTNGKWYVHKEIGHSFLNGSEDEVWTITPDSTYQFKIIKGNSNHIGISNLFTVKYSYTSTGKPYARLGTSAGGTIYLEFASDTTIATTVAELKTWLSSNNLDIYYDIPTATNTEITDTALINALEAIYNASTYKNTTNFSITPSETHAQGELIITYYRDLETMFNNLNNAILSLGNNV